MSATSRSPRLRYRRPESCRRLSGTRFSARGEQYPQVLTHTAEASVLAGAASDEVVGAGAVEPPSNRQRRGSHGNAAFDQDSALLKPGPSMPLAKMIQTPGRNVWSDMPYLPQV